MNDDGKRCATCQGTPEEGGRPADDSAPDNINGICHSAPLLSARAVNRALLVRVTATTRARSVAICSCLPKTDAQKIMMAQKRWQKMLLRDSTAVRFYQTVRFV